MSEIEQLKEELAALKHSQGRINQKLQDLESRLQKLDPEAIFSAPTLVPTEKKATTPPIPSSQPATPKFDWQKMESRFGGSLINFAGVVLVLIGLGYGGTYAIQNGLIGSWVQFGLGMGLSIALLAIGFWQKKKLPVFGEVLIAGGISALFIMAWLGFSYFGLYNRWVAFAAMAFSVLALIRISLLYNRELLAILGLVASFAIPFLTSDGSGSIYGLFALLLLVIAGVSYIVYVRQWFNLYGISSLLSWLVFLAALFQRFQDDNRFALAIFFVFSLFTLFHIGQIVLHRKDGTQTYKYARALTIFNFSSLSLALVLLYAESGVSDTLMATLVLFPTVLCFASGLYYSKQGRTALSTIPFVQFGLLASTTFALVLDSDFNFLLVPLLIAGIYQLSYRVFRFATLNNLCLLTTLLTAAILGFDGIFQVDALFQWEQLPSLSLIPLSIGIASTLLWYLTGYKTSADFNHFSKILNFLIPLGTALALGSLVFAWTQGPQWPDADTDLFFYGTLPFASVVYVAAFLLVSLLYSILYLNTKNFKINLSADFRTASLVCLATCILLFLLIALPAFELLRTLEQELPIAHFTIVLLRYGMYGLMALNGWMVSKFKATLKVGVLQNIGYAGTALVLTVFLSAEVLFWFRSFGLPHPERLALSILWVLIAIFTLYLSLSRRKPDLKAFSFGLIGVAVAKVFVYDLTQLPIEFRILLFVVVGLLLVGFSYLYSRLTKKSD